MSDALDFAAEIVTNAEHHIENTTKGQKAMTSKTITITDLDDVRDGDMVTVEIDGHQYTGPAYAGRDDLLVWGGRILREPQPPDQGGQRDSGQHGGPDAWSITPA